MTFAERIATCVIRIEVPETTNEVAAGIRKGEPRFRTIKNLLFVQINM